MICLLARYFRLHCESGSKRNDYTVNIYDAHLRLDEAHAFRESDTVPPRGLKLNVEVGDIFTNPRNNTHSSHIEQSV